MNDRPRDGAGRPTLARESLGSAIFGDRLGLVLFLAALVFVLPAWRIGFYITDNWTIANAFVAVAEGHLHVDEIVYGPDHGATPGMHVVDGRLYARNYGQVVLALPFLWLLDGLAAVADLALVLAGAFSLLVLALFVQLGRLLDHETPLSYAGVAVALAAFAANAFVAVDVRPYWYPFAALQLSTAVAAALAVVVVYRLLRRLYGRRIGTVGAAAVALSSPVAFWATVPKRHTLTALFVLASLFWFYRSRAAEDRRSTVRFHALAYVPVGLLAWVHAAEGLVLFASLLVADVSTIRRATRSRLAVVTGAFAASLVPFLVTNWLVAGDALTPPRLLREYFSNTDVQLAFQEAVVSPSASAFAHSGAITPTATPEPGGGSSRSILEAAVQLLVGLAGTLVARIEVFLSYAGRSLDVATDWDRLYHVFVRSGYLEEVAARDGQVAVSLSVLESMPLLGGLAAVPVAVVGRIYRGLRTRSWPSRARRDPMVGVDVFVVCFAVLLLALYLGRLPSHVSWTVRYLHPLYPLGVYALFRLPAVRETVDREWSLLGWTYAGTVLVGGQVLVVALAALGPTVGEAVQWHALVAVVAGTATAAWAVTSTAGRGRLSGANRTRLRRGGAVAVGVTCGVTTITLVLWAVAYFPHSPFALPAVGELAARLPFPI